MEFLAAAKQISAELITIKTLLKDDSSVEFCCPFWELTVEPGLRVGVNSPLDEEE